MADVGVAAHITAASSGGPRFDPNLTDWEKRGAANGIWLCLTCAKLIDNDVDRYSASALRGGKITAEYEARKRIGKRSGVGRGEDRKAEAELRQAQKLRSQVEKVMLKSEEERRNGPRFHSRMWKFAETEFIVRCLGDSNYPEFDQNPVISNWLKLETFDFYHNGIEGAFSSAIWKRELQRMHYSK